MSNFKRTERLTIIVILFVLFAYGCGKDNKEPDNSYDALQAFAVMSDITDFSSENETEIVSEIMSYFSDFTTENITSSEIFLSTEKQNTTEITTLPETSELAESTNLSELSEELYVITPSGKKYHRSTCRTVKSIKQHLTKEEAEQLGYEPCKICKPE